MLAASHLKAASGFRGSELGRRLFNSRNCPRAVKDRGVVLGSASSSLGAPCATAWQIMSLRSSAALCDENSGARLVFGSIESPARNSVTPLV